jgi:hypothetical protein
MRTSFLTIAGALLLLPLSLHAQSQDYLRTVIHAGVNCEGCATYQYYTYDNDQTVPGATSLTEDHPLSNDSADTQSHVSTKQGRADATAVANGYTTGNPDHWQAGGGFSNTEADWSANITISCPTAPPGHQLIMRRLMHAIGGLTTNASEFASAEADYRITIEPGSVADYLGAWSSNGGMSGTPLASLQNFTFDEGFSSDTPFSVVYQARMNGYANGSEPGNTGEGHASGNVSLIGDGFVVIDQSTNQPVSYTSTSTEGNARGDVTAAGATYSGFSLTNNAPGRFDSTIQILDGTASRITYVNVGFLSPPDSEIMLASDAATVAGIGADQFVAQMNYDPASASGFSGGESAARLAYRDPVTGKWVNAVLGNNGGTSKLIQRPYDPSADFHLGYYGVDTAHHVVWAVLNYDGEFGVAAVGEPQLAGPINSFSADAPTFAGGQVHFTANAAPGFNLRVQFATPPGTSSIIDESSWQDLLDGGLMIEQPANSGNYVLDSSAYPAGTNIYFRVVASKRDFITNPGSKLGPYTLHPNPDLSPTIFTVNESNASATGLADSVLRFAATQTKRPAGLIVRVQVSTNGTDWGNLQDNNGGLMGYDAGSGKFVLNSTSYPLTGAVSFRAISSAAGKADSISNQVSGFNLTSSKSHITPPRLFFTAGGNVSDLYFDAVFPTDPGGVAVRIQATTTPTDEFSWTDLANGNGGHMTQSIDPLQFLLLANSYPEVKGVYFRAIASQDGAVDGRSLPCGPFDLTPDIPPTVQVIPPPANSGSGTQNDPYVVSGDTLIFAASATPSTHRSILGIALQVDGETVGLFKTANGTVTTSMPAIGDHVLEGYAIDDLGGTARAAAGATFIRVRPSTSSVSSSTKSSTAKAASTGGHTYKLAFPFGAWTHPETWVDENGNPGVPGLNDLAIVDQEVDFELDVTVGAVTVLESGSLIGPGNLTVTKTLTFHGGKVFGYVGMFIEAGTVCNLFNADDIKWYPSTDGQVGTFQNDGGTINVHGAGGAQGMQTFTNKGQVNFQRTLQTPPPAKAQVDPNAANRVLRAGDVNNTGNISALPISALVSHDGSSLISHDGAGLLSHDGSGLVSHDGSSVVNPNGGAIVAAGAGNLLSPNGSNIVSQGAGNLGPNGAPIVSQGAGNIVSQGAGNFHGPATSKARAATAPGAITQSGGEINLSGVILVGPITLNGGALSGSGLVIGDLTNDGGYIAPGNSPGRIGVIGNFTQTAKGTLVMENGGYLPTQFDQLQVSGSAILGGKLDVKTINGYQPGTQDTFSPFTFASVSGSFATVSSNAQIAITGTGIVTSLDITKPQPQTGQPLNIATRLAIQGGDNVLIAGFIVTGPSGATKKVLIRGIGPSLSNLGVAGAISDPLLELHKQDGTVVVNDNWQDGDTSQIPNGFAPSDSRESVIVATLTPGTYSAVVRGAHGETGVGLAEVYDLESGSTAKLANVATRGFVETGDNVLIGGFIIGGTEPTKVLVRAIGPSLAAFGVPNTLPATVLELHDANGSAITNEGWRATQETEIIATTIPPSDDNEAAILATLVPGTYTAVVRGKNDATGIAVIEAYNLQ